MKSPGDEPEVKPKQGDELTMHYVGTLSENGNEFDSSRGRGRPFKFVIGIGQVIKGWDEGVMEMALGERCVLHISRCIYTLISLLLSD